MQKRLNSAQGTYMYITWGSDLPWEETVLTGKIRSNFSPSTGDQRGLSPNYFVHLLLTYYVE